MDYSRIGALLDKEVFDPYEAELFLEAETALRQNLFERFMSELMTPGVNPSTGLPKEETMETLEATWWLFDSEQDMDTMAVTAEDTIAAIVAKLQVKPFVNRDGNPVLFLARFEMPKYGEVPTKAEPPDGITTILLVDFLGGFPLDCIELLAIITELTTLPTDIIVQNADRGVVGPIPENFFAWPRPDQVLINFTALAEQRCVWMATNMKDEPVPSNLHWWVRAFLGNLAGDPTGEKYPIPGEFVALAIRMMPDKPWGGQQSSPFLYSGNYLDTPFYTSGIITEVLDPVAPATYNTYMVQWRKTVGAPTGIIEVRPSDFAEYRVGDRVAILKDVASTKTTQLWKDDDMFTPEEMWQICPITFYGDLAGQST